VSPQLWPPPRTCAAQGAHGLSTAGLGSSKWHRFEKARVPATKPTDTMAMARSRRMSPNCHMHAKPPSPSPKRRPLNNVIFAFYRVRFPPRLRRAAGLDSAAPRAVLASAVYRLRRRFVSEGTPRAGRSRQLQPSPPPVPQRPRRTHRAPHSAAASSRTFTAGKIRPPWGVFFLAPSSAALE